MTSRDFCYWLQGLFELKGHVDGDGFDADQVRTIQAHLAMVFAHEIDPSHGSPEHLDELRRLHEQGKKAEPEGASGERVVHHHHGCSHDIRLMC